MPQDFTLLLIDSPFQNCLTPNFTASGHRFAVAFAWCIPSGGMLKSCFTKTWEGNSLGDLEVSCSPEPLEAGDVLQPPSWCPVPGGPTPLRISVPHSSSSRFPGETSSLCTSLPTFERFSSHAVSCYWGLRTHLVSAARMASMQRTVSGRIKNICMFLSWREYVGSGDDGCAVRLETAAKSVFLHEMCWLIHRTVSSRSHSCANWWAVGA